MKKVASFFSWFMFVGNTIFDIFWFTLWFPNYRTVGGHSVIEYGMAPAWGWGLLITLCIIRIFILIWREYAAVSGKQISAGIITFLFVTFIGGILTMCIPNENKRTKTSVWTDAEKKDFKISLLEEAYDKGMITKEEYERAINNIKGNNKSSNSSLMVSEKEKIDLLERYKKLLDSGAITQSEFDAKKERIMKL